MSLKEALKFISKRATLKELYDLNERYIYYLAFDKSLFENVMNRNVEEAIGFGTGLNSFEIWEEFNDFNKIFCSLYKIISENPPNCKNFNLEEYIVENTFYYHPSNHAIKDMIDIIYYDKTIESQKPILLASDFLEDGRFTKKQIMNPLKLSTHYFLHHFVDIFIPLGFEDKVIFPGNTTFRIVFPKNVRFGVTNRYFLVDGTYKQLCNVINTAFVQNDVPFSILYMIWEEEFNYYSIVFGESISEFYKKRYEFSSYQ